MFALRRYNDLEFEMVCVVKKSRLDWTYLSNVRDTDCAQQIATVIKDCYATYTFLAHELH
jgi:hypothetical protein